MTRHWVEGLLFATALVLWLLGYLLRRPMFAAAAKSPLRHLMPEDTLKRFSRLSWLQPLSFVCVGVSGIIDVSGGPWWRYLFAAFWLLVATPLARIDCMERVALHRAVHLGRVGNKQFLGLVKGYIGNVNDKQRDKSYRLTFRRTSGWQKWGIEITCDNGVVVVLQPRFDTSMNKLLLILAWNYELFLDAVEISEGTLGTKIEMVGQKVTCGDV